MQLSVYSLALSVLFGVVGYPYWAPINLSLPLLGLGLISALLAWRFVRCQWFGLLGLFASLCFAAAYTGLRAELILDQAPPD